jgi:hypothetical protein
MNLQLQPRTNLMLSRGYPACVLSASHSFWRFLSAPSANMLNLVRHYQLRVTAISTHNNPRPTDRQNHPNPIQLP